jgi:hypothetical protein
MECPAPPMVRQTADNIAESFTRDEPWIEVTKEIRALTFPRRNRATGTFEPIRCRTKNGKVTPNHRFYRTHSALIW